MLEDIVIDEFVHLVMSFLKKQMFYTTTVAMCSYKDFILGQSESRFKSENCKYLNVKGIVLILNIFRLYLPLKCHCV